jgi:hypothetical protein
MISWEREARKVISKFIRLTGGFMISLWLYNLLLLFSPRRRRLEGNRSNVILKGWGVCRGQFNEDDIISPIT